MSKLILMRHGRSAWNGLNLFTGWVDIPLDAQGVEESIQGGRMIKDIHIDVAFTSALVRAQMTLVLALLDHSSGKVPEFLHPDVPWCKAHGRPNTLPVHIASELNERMYGMLQGMNKTEMAEKFGAEQIHTWRRSYDVKPPEGESLSDTCARAWPYFQKKVLPHLERGENVFVAAHGNSLRGIIMQLDGLSHEQVVKLEIPTGEPIIYTFEKGKWLKST